jgi:hypothetical protein
LVFGNGKNWQGSAKLSPLSPLPLPSEFCNDEKQCNQISNGRLEKLQKKLAS